MNFISEQKKSFHDALLGWFCQNKRNLPWRKTKDPYRVLVSEVLLQQTQVQTVIPYYNRFVKEFPTVKSLAESPVDRVLKCCEGMGYYARARNLHRTAKEIQNSYGGYVPDDYKKLISLPGIGSYTAGAVGSIAFNKPLPVVDGNVKRVLCRLYGIKKPVQKKLWKLAEDLIPENKPGEFNQALMELGALVCLPRNPRCKECCVSAFCAAYKKGKPEVYPAKLKKKTLPYVTGAVGVIKKNGKLLISKRPEKGLLGGMWEFPGGKVKKDETLKHALKREIQEELGISVQVKEKLMEVPHTYSHFRVKLHVFRCKFLKGKPMTLGCADWRWVSPGQLSEFAFPSANKKIISFLTRKFAWNVE